MSNDPFEPQTQAKVAAGSGTVFISTENGQFIVLTSDLAHTIGNNLPAMAEISRGIPCSQNAPTAKA